LGDILNLNEYVINKLPCRGVYSSNTRAGELVYVNESGDALLKLCLISLFWMLFEEGETSNIYWILK